MEAQDEYLFTPKIKKHSFNVRYNFSYISIEKIILQSHMNNDYSIWSPIISKTKLVLTGINDRDKSEKKYPFNLLQFVSVQHRFPLFEPSIEFPSKIERDYFSNHNFYTRLELEIQIEDLNITNFEYLILLRKTPGIY